MVTVVSEAAEVTVTSSDTPVKAAPVVTVAPMATVATEATEANRSPVAISVTGVTVATVATAERLVATVATVARVATPLFPVSNRAVLVVTVASAEMRRSVLVVTEVMVVPQWQGVTEPLHLVVLVVLAVPRIVTEESQATATEAMAVPAETQRWWVMDHRPSVVPAALVDSRSTATAAPAVLADPRPPVPV